MGGRGCLGDRRLEGGGTRGIGHLMVSQLAVSMNVCKYVDLALLAIAYEAVCAYYC